MLTKEASSGEAIILATEDASFVSMTKTYNEKARRFGAKAFYRIDVA
jgi:hypothetical protein